MHWSRYSLQTKPTKGVETREHGVPGSCGTLQHRCEHQLPPPVPMPSRTVRLQTKKSR